MPLTTLVTSKPRVSILCSPVSSMRAAICTPPARLAVGATTNVSCDGASPAFCPTQAATASVGAARVSSTSTPRSARSAYRSLANSSCSTRACARSGPDPIAKYFPTWIAHPAYCDAIQLTAG